MTRILVYSDADHAFTKRNTAGYRVSVLHEETVSGTGADGQSAEPWGWAVSSGAMRTVAKSPGVSHYGVLQKNTSGVELLVGPPKVSESNDSSPTYSDAGTESPTSVLDVQAGEPSTKKAEVIQVAPSAL
jgi:hypothetical protein